MITTITPTIPVRQEKLHRALRSICLQELAPTEIMVISDTERRGAGATRNRMLDRAVTEWVAFLDDDDELLPHHLKRCWEVQQATGVDVVVPWFQCMGGSDPIACNRGIQPDPLNMHQFGITCLVRREAIGEIRFIEDPWEDFHFWSALGAAGATFHAIPDETWRYWHHGLNTSGRPDRW